MACAILTEGVIKAALRRQLSTDQRAVVLRHLREPCEACLDLLEGWTGEEILPAADDLLFPRELEKILSDAAPAKLIAVRPAPRLARLERGRWPRFALGAAAAVALLGLATVLRPPERHAVSGLKGTAAPTTAMIPLVGARTPTPHVVRALGPGAHLAPGELLLLRIRLDAPAWVYLVSQKQGEAAELLWPLQATARHEAGEFELAESGSALAIEPGALGNGARLLLIASPEPIEERRLQIREPLRTRGDLEKLFPGCGVDVLPVSVEPR
jgi:hypothetical protein